MVLLAPPARSLIEMAVEQLERASASDTRLPAMREKAALLRAGKLSNNDLALGVSGKYFNDLSERNPMRRAEQAGLPILIVHGTHDREVSEADIRAWQRALGEAAHFISLPGLTHLFASASGDNRVDRSLATAIATFIATLGEGNAKSAARSPAQ
jgi:alpha-beta hydrolase superfamily lysophospholipase